MYKTFSVVAFLVAAAAAAAPEARGAVCARSNGYYSIDGSCDAYIECREFIPHEMLCPDGLHYDPSAAWPAYPCAYPADVTCAGRGAPQPAIPTAECPHQYGFFPSAGGACGNYRMCVAGLAIEMTCPAGLAFNVASARCDWPDLVPGCDADAFLGFKCPAMQRDESGAIIGISNFKYPGSCYSFYSCESGRARLLSCDAGSAFDALRGVCASEETVICDK